jgi:hypothetical protein
MEEETATTRVVINKAAARRQFVFSFVYFILECAYAKRKAVTRVTRMCK